MTEFKKYPSIENHYQNKFIATTANQFGDEIYNQTYIVREKLDGANIQLVFTPNEKMKVARRTAYLEEGEKFFDIWNTLKKYDNLTSRFQKLSDDGCKTLRVYGEIYGSGVQKRVDYGKEKYISIFDIMSDDEFMDQMYLSCFLSLANCDEILPNLYGTFETLHEALEFKLPENIEGAIIQPLNKNYFLASGSRFILKKKSESFDDRSAPKKVVEERKQFSALNIKFRGYINENRVIDVFSKHGEIEEPKQISQYIKLVLEDAKEDFLKDHNLRELIENYEPKFEKEIFNVGSAIVFLLKKHL